MDSFTPSNRNKVKRVPKRGFYDKATVYKILDEAFMCHIGFVVDGQPFVIPTAFGRKGDQLFFHGATTSRLAMHLQEGFPVCITVTHLDGLVLARSAFHHSMNYRSVVVFGKARAVAEEDKEAALKIISDQILKGRWEESRPPTPHELKATLVLEMTIEEASAKIRTGPPADDAEDYNLPIWAGTVPMKNIYLKPVDDPKLSSGIPRPKSVNRFE